MDIETEWSSTERKKYYLKMQGTGEPDKLIRENLAQCRETEWEDKLTQ